MCYFLIWFAILTPGTGAQYTYAYDATKTYYQQAASATTYAAAAQPYDTTAQSGNPKVYFFYHSVEMELTFELAMSVFLQ